MTAQCLDGNRRPQRQQPGLLRLLLQMTAAVLLTFHPGRYEFTSVWPITPRARRRKQALVAYGAVRRK